MIRKHARTHLEECTYPVVKHCSTGNYRRSHADDRSRRTAPTDCANCGFRVRRMNARRTNDPPSPTTNPPTRTENICAVYMESRAHTHTPKSMLLTHTRSLRAVVVHRTATERTKTDHVVLGEPDSMPPPTQRSHDRRIYALLHAHTYTPCKLVPHTPNMRAHKHTQN